jgi:CxxC motif-containing protein
MLGPDDEILNISGNKCKLGVEYVQQEIQDPRRILPTSVRVKNGTRPIVPVWTPEPMPKGLIMELSRESRRIEVEAPVHVGDVVLDDWRGLGIRLVASGEVERAD